MSSLRSVSFSINSLTLDSRVCWWLIMAYILSAPFISLTGIPISWKSVPLMDWHRFFEIAIIFMCTTWAITFLPPLKAVPPALLAGWGSVFLLGLASALQAQFVSFALLEWSWLLLVTLLTFSMRQWGIAKRDTLDHLLLLLAMTSSLAYLSWFWQLNAEVYLDFRPVGPRPQVTFPGFPNIRFFSDYQSLMLLLLPLALYRLTKPGITQQACALLIALYFSLALIVGSRSLIAAHLALHGLMLAYFGRAYWPFLKTQLHFWAYGTALFLILTKLIPLFISAGGEQVPSHLIRTDSSGRTVIWGLALRMIQENPMMGVGPLHFAASPNPIASSPHNFPIQIAVEWGLPAAIILLGLLGHHIHTRLKSLQSQQDFAIREPVSLAMTCAAISVLLQSLVSSSPLNYPVGQAVALLCFAYPLQSADQSATKNIIHKQSGLQSLSLIALILCIFSMTTLQSIRERNHCFLYNPWPTKLYAPRFWQQGWIIGPCGDGVSLFTIMTRPHN